MSSTHSYKSPVEASKEYHTHKYNAITFNQKDIDVSFELTGHQLMLLAEVQQRPINPTIRDKGPRANDMATKKTLESLLEIGLLERKNGSIILSRHAQNGEYVLNGTQKQPF